MAERAQEEFDSAGTYVVQVPKDQIYRVPPPENALIFERYQAPHQKIKTRGILCCSSFICCLVFASILTIAAAIVVAAACVIFKPGNPIFHVEQLVVVNHTANVQYNLSIVVSNPNKISKVSYNQDGSSSVLTQEKHELASGKFPGLQQGMGETISDVTLTMTGTARSRLRTNVGKNKTLTDHTTLELTMIIPIRITTGILEIGDTVLQVTCEIGIDSLGMVEKNIILSHSCITERK